MECPGIPQVAHLPVQSQCLRLTPCPTSRTMCASCQGESPCRPNIPAMPDHLPITAAKPARPPALIKRNNRRARTIIMARVLTDGLLMGLMPGLIPGPMPDQNHDQMPGQMPSQARVMPVVFRSASLPSLRPQNPTRGNQQSQLRLPARRRLLMPMWLSACASTRP